MKVTLKEEREAYRSMFGSDSILEENTNLTRQELDEAIDDCNAMLQYSIDRNNKEETAYWRRLLQENKVQRRQSTA